MCHFGARTFTRLFSSNLDVFLNARFLETNRTFTITKLYYYSSITIVLILVLPHLLL